MDCYGLLCMYNNTSLLCRNLPNIETLMQEWPPQFEELLNSVCICVCVCACVCVCVRVCVKWLEHWLGN